MPYIGRGPAKSGAFRILDDVSGSFNGSTVTFALTVASTALTVGLPETLIIAVDGVIQEPGSAYTISGSNIVFGSAPQADATFWGVELGDVGGIAQQAVTQSASDNSTSIATTAYVDAQVATEDTIAEMGDVTLSSIGSGEVLKWNGSAWINNNLAELGVLPVANPTFTGILTVGSAAMTEADLEMLDGITAGTAAASKAVVLDSSTNITGIGTISAGAITSSGIVTGTGFTAGSAVLAEAELELLDGLTAGTAIASKVVTTDSNIDTTGQRNLTISGELDAATGDFSGAVDVAGAFSLAGTAVTSTAAELNLLDALDRGSILYGNASGVTTVLGQGGTGTVLTSDGDDISWQAAGGGVVSGGTDNAVLRADGTGGSTSQGSCVIISNAGAISPQFGTACLPGLSFGVDTDTGIYRSGTNIMSFATAGVEQMRILATGTVEIETATGCLSNLTLIQKSGGTTGAQLFFSHQMSAVSSCNSDENYIFTQLSDNGGTLRTTNYIGWGWVSNNSSSMESEIRFGTMNNASGSYNTTAILSYAGVFTDSSGEKYKDYEGDPLCIYGGISGQVITDKIKQLSGSRYHTKNHPDWKPILERHISPTAEQFYDLFGTGRDPRQPTVCSAQHTNEPRPGLAPKDMAGVALLGLQELIVRVERLENGD